MNTSLLFIRIGVINSRNDPTEKKSKFSVSHSQDVACFNLIDEAESLFFFLDKRILYLIRK